MLSMLTSAASPRSRQIQTGFSLIEMAVVLMIVGTLLSGVLMAVGQSMESGRRTNTAVQLRQVEEALYGFALTMERLPCPSTLASAGREALIPPVAGGLCTQAHGFVPYVTLGLFGTINSDNLLTDPWGNPLRYSVSTELAMGSPAFTSSAGLKTLYDFANTLLVPGDDMLRVCNSAACGTILADTVPALVWSMGPNGAGFTSADETENNDDDITFVSRTYSEEFFDDQLVWLSPHVLFNRLINAGQLQ